MIRLTFFTILGIAIAFVAYWVSANPGDVLVTWQGWEIRLSVAVSVMLLILYTVLIFATLKLFKWLNISALLSSPKRLAAKRSKGEKILDQAWGSYALDDYDVAIKLGLRAKAALGNNHNVLRLLAKATQKSNKDKNPYIDALKSTPGNAAWAQKQELMDLIANKSWSTALTIIQSLLQDYPKNKFLLKKNVMISACLSDWNHAKEAITTAEKEKGALTKKDINHYKAVIDYALALEKKAAGKKDESLSLLKSVLKLDPTYAPAALAAAKILLEQAQPKASEKIILNIWKKAPNRELGEIALELYPAESSNETFRRISNLSMSAPNFPESQHILARAAIDSGHWPQAREAIDKVIEEKNATKETYMLLAALEKKQKNDDIAVGVIQKKIENAKNETNWTCSECETAFSHYTPLCSECGSFDGLK
ncbi:MAG: heme biosynthesis HemY N-terminal domain-containing protein, partial [Emcibacteraceae bacterium]|nr:heme biosynthesis HemY N-terminal domain-containing protein [Emcibacteraceae bacterium]